VQHVNLTGKMRFYLIDIIRGTNTSRVLSNLRKSQFYTPIQLQQLQTEKLKHYFTRAQQSTDYYHHFKAYTELPVLTKKVVAANFDQFVSRTFKKRLIRKTTGGSTAEPFTYYTTQQSQSWLWAGILLSWETAGYQLGEKVIFFAGTSLIKAGWQYRIFYKMMNVDVLPASPLNDTILEQYALAIQQKRAAIIYGYAHAIAVMADYLNSRPPVYFPGLKAIVCTAEPLSLKMRQSIENAFGVKVYDQYGCNEAGIAAFECEHGNMHLINTRAFFETTDEGFLISTDLSNEGFPLIKYNTNDIVELSKDMGTCTCKRGFPVIKSVVGRQSDLMTDKKNNVLHASFFGIVFSKDSSVKKFQLVYNQETVELNIQTDNTVPAAYYNKYLELLKQHCSFDHYTLKLNQPFTLTANGKHKEVIDNRKTAAAQ